MVQTAQHFEDIVSFYAYVYLEHWTNLLGETAAKYLFARNTLCHELEECLPDMLTNETELEELFVKKEPLLRIKKEFDKLDSIAKEQIKEYARTVAKQLNKEYTQNKKIVESFFDVISLYSDLRECVCSYHFAREYAPRYADYLQYKVYNIPISYGLAPSRFFLPENGSAILSRGSIYYDDLLTYIEQMPINSRHYLICSVDDTNDKASALTKRHLGIGYIEEIIQNNMGVMIIFSDKAMNERLEIKRSSFTPDLQCSDRIIPIRFKNGDAVKQFKIEHCFSYVPADYSFFTTEENSLTVSLKKVRGLPREGSLNAVVLLLSDKDEYLSGFDYYQSYKKLHDIVEKQPKSAQVLMVSCPDISKDGFERSVIKGIESILSGGWKSLRLNDIIYWLKHVAIEEEEHLSSRKAAKSLLSVLEKTEVQSMTISSIKESLKSIVEGGIHQCVSFDTAVQWAIELDNVTGDLDLSIAADILKSSRPKSGRFFAPTQIKYPIYTLFLVAEGLEEYTSKISKRKHYLMNRGDTKDNSNQKQI